MKRRTPRLGSGFARATLGRGRGTLSFPTLSITQAPTVGADNVAFSPSFIVQHPHNTPGVTITATRSVNKTGVLIGTQTAVTNGSGAATFSTLGMHIATKIIITQQPAGAVNNQPLVTQITGNIQDINGNIIQSAGVVITLTVNVGSRIGTNTVVTDANGLWTYVGSGFGLSVPTPPTVVTITASSPDLTAAVATPITVSV